ncbi:MAG: hypothetical protein ACI9IP_002791 [Arcticibacterium sp.]|jgi:hypothetical protein
MKPVLSSYIDLLRPYISEELVSKPYLDRIHRIADNLPVLSYGSFECWLHDKEDRVDLNVCINPRLNEHKRMVEHDFSWINDLKHREKQTGILRFLESWTKPNFILQSFLGEFCQIYDIQNSSSLEIPIPWIYISFLRSVIGDDPEVKATIVQKTLGFIEGNLSEDLLNGLNSLLIKLPESVRFGTLGFHSRGGINTMRLYIEIKTLKEVLEIMGLIGWSGDLDDFEKQILPYSDLVTYFGLAMDFDGEIGIKVGLDCFFEKTNWTAEIETFLERLCDRGICTNKKKDALKAWNGRNKVTNEPGFWSWPDEIKDESVKMVELARMVYYVKLIYEPGKSIIAKAYPMFFRNVIRKG